MEHTPFGLTKIDPGESPWTDGGSFFGRNQDVIDRLLHWAQAHVHDGHPPLATPAAGPDLVAAGTGGLLDTSTTIYAAFTAVDDQDGETLASPITSIDTPASVGAPAAPTGTPDFTAGDLPAGTYIYAITATDALGGESPPSDPLLVELEQGHPQGQVLLAGLQSAAVAAGGVAWRLYRSTNAGVWGFLAAGNTETFTDDCSHCADPQLPPPAEGGTGTAVGGASITATVAAAALPAGTVSYRLYVSNDPTLPGPCLVGEFPASDAGTGHQVTTLALDNGAPPIASTSLGGATPLTYTWKPPVATATDLPADGNNDGDARLTLDDLSLHAWDGAAWQAVAGGGTWKAPVADAASLPAAGNTTGDVRLTLADMALHGWDGATWQALGGSAAGLTVEDEGTALTQRDTLNFAGAGVAVTDDAANARTVVTIDAAATLNYQGAWDAGTAYAAGAVVVSGGSSYLALTATTGQDPATTPASWGLIAAKGDQGATGEQGPAGVGAYTFRGAWDVATAYAINDVVTEAGSSYVALAATTGEDPATTPASWGLLAAAGQPGGTAALTIEDESVALTQRDTLDFQGAGVTATDDAANNKTIVTIDGGGAGGNLGDSWKGDWDPLAAYASGDVVYYGGSSYLAMADVPAPDYPTLTSPFANHPDFTPIGLADPRSGAIDGTEPEIGATSAVPPTRLSPADLYAIVVTTGGDLTFKLTSATFKGFIELYSNTGGELAWDDTYDANDLATLVSTRTPGTYWIRVSAYNGTDTGDYTLEVTSANAVVTPAVGNLTPDLDPDHWHLVAEKGDQGEPGPNVLASGDDIEWQQDGVAFAALRALFTPAGELGEGAGYDLTASPDLTDVTYDPAMWSLSAAGLVGSGGLADAFILGAAAGGPIGIDYRLADDTASTNTAWACHIWISASDRLTGSHNGILVVSGGGSVINLGTAISLPTSGEKWVRITRVGSIVTLATYAADPLTNVAPFASTQADLTTGTAAAQQAEFIAPAAVAPALSVNGTSPTFLFARRLVAVPEQHRIYVRTLAADGSWNQRLLLDENNASDFLA